MIKYNDASFYTTYFKGLDDFSLIEGFKESTEQDEKDLFVGIVEVLNTIHPLIIRVEIPFSFPHKNLTFRTKSLHGYPHLIHNGKIKHGSWFCLNTPFAETAEEQLNQEIFRLKEWIEHQMRNDLPPTINDPNVREALAFANAYEWENPDEVKEYSSQAMLTFVGNFDNDVNYFKEELGFLHCVKSPDNRFYAISNHELANHKLPYIIVDQPPKSNATLSDFILLKEQYGWDDKTCKHLLPNLDTSSSWSASNFQTINFKDWGETEALVQIKILEKELQKDESYLLATDNIWGQNKKLTKVLPSQKPILFKRIKSLKDSIIKNHGLREKFDIPNPDDMTEEEYAQIEWEEYLFHEVYPYEWHHFAFGIKHNKGITWKIIFTNHKARKCEELRFDLIIETFGIEKLTAYPLNHLNVQVVTEEMFFGRGSFSSNLKSKKIALVGLGAIGSIVASSLAHCGISKIGLWDFDIVEPGNICRSAYTIKNLGESKVLSIASIINSINPFIETKDLCKHGTWHHYNANHKEFVGKSFYANINYNSQEDAIKELDGYDLIIDCTGSNEMLHFLSYAASKIDIISMCITNHANDLLCITNKDGNPFELRKAYLSRIEQDTKNFYVEGSGCYSPTFLANNCDIAALVNLALRNLNNNLANNQLMHSTIYSYSNNGIIADKISTYKLDGYDIYLNITSETLYDAEDIEDSIEGDIGYIFGSYSKDGKQIMATHIVGSLNATELLTDAYNISKGIIDYIGDLRYS